MRIFTDNLSRTSIYLFITLLYLYNDTQQSVESYVKIKIYIMEMCQLKMWSEN